MYGERRAVRCKGLQLNGRSRFLMWKMGERERQKEWAAEVGFVKGHTAGIGPPLPRGTENNCSSLSSQHGAQCGQHCTSEIKLTSMAESGVQSDLCAPVLKYIPWRQSLGLKKEDSLLLCQAKKAAANAFNTISRPRVKGWGVLQENTGSGRFQ